MDCGKMREKLAAYLEGVVSPEERGLIEGHLLSCQRCRMALEDLKRTDELVKGLEEVEPPPWLKQRVMSRVRAEGEAKGSVLRKLFYPLHVKVPIEAFATVLIAVVAIYVFRAVETEIKRVQAPSTAQQVVARDEASREAPPKEASPKEAPPQESALQETGPQKASPEGAQEGRVDLPALARETLPSAPLGLRTLAPKRTETIGVTLHAKDVGTAIREVADLLAQLGAYRIERESAEGAEVVTAELQAEKLKNLVQKLKAVGEVKEKDSSSAPGKGSARIRIEIVGK